MKVTTDKNKTHEDNKMTVKEIVRNMCLMDDEFMSAVLQHKECLELVLNIILDRNDLKVRDCKTQYTISSLYGRSIRLDVFAEDTNGKRYDIEVQNIVSDKEIKRIRFYSALMDSDYLNKSEEPDTLPETYVIFILEKDMYTDGLPIYHIERVAKETGKSFDDGLHIILVNSQVQNETALGKLMSDFHCREPKKMNYKVLSEQADNYKNYEKGESTVSQMVEEYAKRVAEEAVREAVREAAKKEAITVRETEKKEKIKLASSLLSENIFSAEKIAQLTELSIDEVKKLASEKLSALTQ